MYNISLKDELLSETRRSFDSEAAMDTWLQQQVEALLVAYNASQKATRRKACTATPGIPKNIELTPRVQRFKRGNPWYISDEELDRLRYEYLTEKYR
jgi:hypothetical protein